MNIQKVVRNALNKQEEHAWENLYWCIDLHNTIIPSHHTSEYIKNSVYPAALQVLRVLTQRDDMCLILFTSTTEEDVKQILLDLKEQGVIFNYLNINPECKSKGYADFSKKFYYDILLDDKAGFEYNDWKLIYEVLMEQTW